MTPISQYRPNPHEPRRSWLSLDISLESDSAAVDGSDSLVVQELGSTIPQGSLFAYLFRRFGYPEHGWDDYKELVSYLLTTTRPDMLLRITPYAEGDTHISFTFLAPPDVSTACRQWPWKEVQAHQARLGDWIEAQGALPDWLGPWFERRVAEYNGHAAPSSWKEIIWHLKFMGRSEPGFAERVAWIERMDADYQAALPAPLPLPRGPDVGRWRDDDPLKPYALAAIETLADLQRVTWVRDCAIGLRGFVKDTEIGDDEDVDGEDDQEELSPALISGSAGHGASRAINDNPAAFSELMDRVRQLGEGNAAAGLARALELLPKNAPTI